MGSSRSGDLSKETEGFRSVHGSPVLTESQVQALERRKLEKQVEGEIDHSKTKARHPQSNGICERFHRTIQDEFYAVAFRKKLYNSIEDLQKDLDQWIDSYNNKHIKASMFWETPMQTFLDTKELAKNKYLDNLQFS